MGNRRRASENRRSRIGPAMKQVVHDARRGLSPEEAQALLGLLHRVWPGKEPDAAAAERYATRLRDNETRQHAVFWEEGAPIAHALTFRRRIFTEAGPLEVLALAGVCVEPGRRREGFGEAIVRQALCRLEGGDYSVALFQTGVPEFYQRLGARLVPNRFINRQAEDAEANPWWEPHVMIYPADATWPEGVIDLNGGGY